MVVKIRQGRKACTLITGHETFGLQADDLAEELRKICASSTSGISWFLYPDQNGLMIWANLVSPIQGKPNSLEVMVQGKQTKAVTDLLLARGVPKKWIEAAELKKEKEKK